VLFKGRRGSRPQAAPRRYARDARLLFVGIFWPHFGLHPEVVLACPSLQLHTLVSEGVTLC
jgi:hypothetical protein